MFLCYKQLLVPVRSLGQISPLQNETFTNQKWSKLFLFLKTTRMFLFGIKKRQTLKEEPIKYGF
jgi:hypothetical protein